MGSLPEGAAGAGDGDTEPCAAHLIPGYCFARKARLRRTCSTIASMWPGQRAGSGGHRASEGRPGHSGTAPTFGSCVVTHRHHRDAPCHQRQGCETRGVLTGGDRSWARRGDGRPAGLPGGTHGSGAPAASPGGTPLSGEGEVKAGPAAPSAREPSPGGRLTSGTASSHRGCRRRRGRLRGTARDGTAWDGTGQSTARHR